MITIAAVMAKWLVLQTEKLMAWIWISLFWHWLQVLSAMQGIALLAFYAAITGPTEFIISFVNLVKMVNMP